MRTLLALLPVAGCAAMMVVCARMMRRGDAATGSTTADEAADVARLRDEVAALRARLEPTNDDDRDLPVR